MDVRPLFQAALFSLLLHANEDLHTEGRLVLINASVFDDNNRFHPELRNENFQLFDDGVEMQLRSVGVEDVPLSTIILLDISRSMKDAIGDARIALDKYLDKSRPGDEFCLIAFNGHSPDHCEFVTDANDVRLHASVTAPAPGPPAREGEPDNTVEIFLALGDTIRRKRLPVVLFEDLLSAFAQDVTVTRYAGWDDVLDYSRRSANPVGRLVLRIAGYDEPRLDGWSDAICSALQLTNFWQDLKVDFDRGRIYLPAEELRGHGAAQR